MISWEDYAIIVLYEFGGIVDWTEKFFICPDCGEPMYEEDYPYMERYCPICGFDLEED